MRTSALSDPCRAAAQRAVPVLRWLPAYNAEKGISDLVAGVTIGLTLIPQVIAYAALAGLSPEFGLYSSLCGGLIYAVFGTIPELNIAPTALISLLTYSYTHESPIGPVQASIMLCFLSGIIELSCGILHLGFLVDFVSTPVVAAFTSAGAITIASAQVKNLLGLKFSAESFKDVWLNVFKHIKETQKWDFTLGIFCCIFLLGLRHLKDYGAPPLAKSKKGDTDGQLALKKIIWFVSVSRNALIVVGSAVIAVVFEAYDMKPFSLTSKVPAGLPSIGLPQFEVTAQNTTYTFGDIATQLGSGLFVVPFVSILGNVAISKAFAHGKVVDASQEMVAVGLCNIGGSLFNSFPVNASFSRAAVSNASGIRTPFGGIYTASMVFLALTFLTPYFSYIPKATLAAVIICAVLFMVEVTMTKMIWDIHKLDIVPFSITFVACLALGIEVGILIGVIMDVILLLYYNARPKVVIETVVTEYGIEYTRITPTSAILYPSAEYIREKIMKTNVEDGKNHKVFVLDCSKMNRADFTAAKCTGALISDLKKAGKTVVFFGLETSAAAVITGSCKEECICTKTEEELANFLRSSGTNSGVTEQKTIATLNCDCERLSITKL